MENGLSIQEHINNEVWCVLSIVNIPTLSFENNKVYVFVLDNDYKKETKVKASETLKEKLKILDINYRIEYEENDNSLDGGLPRRYTPRNDKMTTGDCHALLAMTKRPTN